MFSIDERIYVSKSKCFICLLCVVEKYDYAKKIKATIQHLQKVIQKFKFMFYL